jgi:hypothetical protein
VDNGVYSADFFLTGRVLSFSYQQVPMVAVPAARPFLSVSRMPWMKS